MTLIKKTTDFISLTFDEKLHILDRAIEQCRQRYHEMSRQSSISKQKLIRAEFEGVEHQIKSVIKSGYDAKKTLLMFTRIDKFLTPKSCDENQPHSPCTD